MEFSNEHTKEQIIKDCAKLLPNPYEWTSNEIAIEFYMLKKVKLSLKTVNAPAKETAEECKAYFKRFAKGQSRFWKFDRFSDNFNTPTAREYPLPPSRTDLPYGI